jgi:ATP-dependent exoDNAse (exonuclease V) beta subunit
LQVLIERTQLRERLAVLPPEDFTDLQQDVDAILALAAEEEAKGATLADFAEKLRADFVRQRDVRLSANEGIQLITAQKSKGLEWQAVILPFIGRGIIPPSPRYPCILKVPGSSEPLVALTKEDFDEEGRALNKTAVQQEMARLLYVAATRARHTLVLAYDKHLFLDSKKSIPPTAQLKHFGKNEAAVFARLGTEAEIDASTAERTAASRGEIGAAPAFRSLSAKERQQARQHADDFVHKFNPSGYDEEIALTLDQETAGSATPRVPLVRSRDNTPATLYGQWWHSLFQEMPWAGGIETADSVFRKRLEASPDKSRSTREWKLVREYLAADSAVRRFLTRAGAKAHAEFPFAWSIDQRACIEGVIDLLLIDSNAGNCLLVDWKTNRIKKGEQEKLQQRYRPQIAAYWKAVGEITGYGVEAGIFATATGEFMPYAANELEAEWTRLRALPADQLIADVSAL